MVTRSGNPKYWGQVHDLGLDHSCSGTPEYLVAGESLVFGDVCYVGAGKLYKADADALASMPARFICVETIAQDDSGMFVRDGLVRDDSWSWTPGVWLYASSTAGSLSESAPGSGKFCQVFAEAITADVIAIGDKTVVEQA